MTAQGDITPILQEWWLPLSWPLASDRFVVQVYDADVGRDEHVASMFFSLKDLVQKGSAPAGYYYWQNLYGAPKGYSGEAVDKMNENPEFGSAWLGRCLIHIECTAAKHPERREQAVAGDVKQQAIDLGLFTQNEYEIIAELGLGICLPGYENYTVKIQIGDFVLRSAAPMESRQGYCRWSERINMTTFKSFYSTPEQMDRIYVYLMSGEVPICWWKGQVTEFLDPNPQYRWLVLKNDAAIGTVVNDYDAGMIQMKLALNAKHLNGPVDFKQYDAWKRPPPRRLATKKVRCFIFQCRDIPAGDEDGQSDAYVTVWNPSGDDHSTKVMEKNLNPIFFETVEMEYEMSDIANSPPIVINMWDKDDSS